MSSFRLALVVFNIFGSLLLSAAEITTSLVADQKIAVPGTQMAVIMTVNVPDGWHVYWKNPGDVGSPFAIHWQLPEGLTLLSIDWPTPERFEHDDMVTLGYTKSVDFLATFALSPELKEGELLVGAELDWVACSDSSCLPGAAHVETTVALGKIAQVDRQVQEKVEAKRAALPKSLIGQFSQDASGVHLVLPFEESIATADELFFLPEPSGMSEHESALDWKGAVRAIQTADKLHVTFPGTHDLKQPLKGILLVRGGSGYAIEAQSTSEMGVLVALGFAFLGGLLLNVMPCVLPVLSLKAVRLAQMAHEQRRSMWQHGLAFTLGVLVSFWALAGLLLALRASGEAVGWGFQLQNPLFIGFLALLFLLFALNLFGLFEMGTSVASAAGASSLQRGKKLVAAFWSGVLATAVATPCTGPFMGSALGFALTQSAAVSLAIFTALGLGMALPYAWVALVPSAARWLPKPGAWMELFKQALGFVLLATVLWLLWVFLWQTDPFALFMLLGAFLVVSCAAWLYGRSAASLAASRPLRTCALLLFIGSLGLIYSAGTTASIESSADSQEVGWEPFSQERVEQLRAEGRPVFIDFTAKWCLICQANHLILTHPSVEQAFNEKGVVRMKADWTKKDPHITRALESFGRTGVPLYVAYNKEEPTILPQLLTPGAIVEAFK